MEFIRDNEAQGLLERHEYKGFGCFSLSEAGFRFLGVEYSPKLDVHRDKARLTCFVNHLRYGISKEIKKRKNIEWHKWVSGGRFAVRPLIVGRIDKEERILPEGMLVTREAGELYRLWFVHYWSNPERIRRDLLLYSLYEKSGRHIDRFFLSDDSSLRVLCLILELEVLKQAEKYLKRDKVVETVLFLPFSQTKAENPLSSKIWRNIWGNKKSVI